MEVAHKFLPTAGVVGLLPMVTYFFMVVAIFSFLGCFLFTLATLSSVHPKRRTVHTLTAIISAIATITYYLIQTDYRNLLTELSTVSDTTDRQTLIRESYNAIGQYRYMDWFVTAPLLLLQIIFALNLRLEEIKRPLATLLIMASFLFFVSYIGHQQLSFDNEIQVSPKVGWGLLATLAYGFILLTLYRLWNQFSEQKNPESQRAYRLTALITAGGWGVYLLGYFLTVTDVDFNWIHLAFTITDLVTKIGVGIVVYFVSSSALNNVRSERSE